MRIIEGGLRVAASDVANFLACQQLTQLDLRAAQGTLRPPHPIDLGFEDLVRRGEEHERAVLERFRAKGYEVADLGETWDSGYQGALRSKLLEEAQEAEAAPDEQLASELADVLEVLRALATAYGMTSEDIERQANRKRAQRGGFYRRIFLEHVDQAP